MSIVDTIQNYIEISKNKQLEIKSIDFIPTIDNIGGGNKAYNIKIIALYVEFRGSDDINFETWKSSSDLIHTIIELVKQVIEVYEGKIVNIEGNGFLAIWSTNKSNINKSVEAALAINWLLSTKIKDIAQNNTHFNYGIGIHDGEALAIKVSVPNTEFDEEKVTFISPSINFVMSMSSQLFYPESIGISIDIYNKLYEESKTVKKSFVLFKYQSNIWEDRKIRYLKKDFEIKITKHFLNLENNQISKL